MEKAMGRLVKLQEADYALHNATFIAKLPCSTPSAEEWLTESEVLYKSEKGSDSHGRTRDARRNPMASSNPSANPTLSDMQRAVKDTVHLHWQIFLTQGVIMVILGVLAVVWPQISTIAVDVYVGWLFLLSGVVGLASMFLAQNVQAYSQ
jgi:hypothetical protein